jgi:hypothetical protein
MDALRRWSEALRREAEEKVAVLYRWFEERHGKTRLEELGASNVWAKLINRKVITNSDGEPCLEVSLTYSREKHDVTIHSLEDLGRKAQELRDSVFSHRVSKRGKYAQTGTRSRKTKPVHVPAGSPLTAKKKFEELLSNIHNGEVLLYDGYVNHKTLYPLMVLKGRATALKILANKILDRQKFDDYRKDLETQLGIPVEVRTNTKVHDRFLINKGRCWKIGTSLKSLGGTKDTVIQEVDAKPNEDMFWENWNEAITA